jgi:hypothetical protein
MMAVQTALVRMILFRVEVKFKGQESFKNYFHSLKYVSRDV